MSRPSAVLLLVTLSLVSLCAGCVEIDPRDGEATYTPPDAFPPTTPQPAVAAANAFGFNLFHKLTTDNTNNVFISPTSLMLALAMCYNGAGGGTKTAIAKALQVSDIPLNDLNGQLSVLQKSLQTGEENVQVSLANSLWADKGFPLTSDFTKLCDTYYDATVRNVDLQSSGAGRAINGWARKATNGLIPEIVTQQNLGQAALLLLDAVYFKGKWSNPFKNENTKQADFSLPGGRQKSVRMMERAGEYIYTEDAKLQAIALPYGVGQMNMIVVLPRDRQGLPALQRAMTDKTWTALLGKMAKRGGTIKLPRFEMMYEAYLNDALKAMGAGMAFGPAADFSGLSKVPTMIGFAKHVSFLRVTEKKTEAAAVSLFSMKCAAPPPPSFGPFEMIVDHPFLLGIVDTKTGAVVFLGGINDPKETRAGE
jgi:serine protease inhibitor